MVHTRLDTGVGSSLTTEPPSCSNGKATARPVTEHIRVVSISRSPETAVVPRVLGSARAVGTQVPQVRGLWRSLVAHLTVGQAFVGSNPARPTFATYRAEFVDLT